MSRLVEAGESQEEGFELPVVFLLRNRRFRVAQTGDGLFQFVAPLAQSGGEKTLAGGAHKVDLVGAESIDGGAVFGLARGPQSAEPVGRCPAPVAVVVEQGVFGRQAGVCLVELLNPTRGGQEGFEE